MEFPDELLVVGHLEGAPVIRLRDQRVAVGEPARAAAALGEEWAIRRPAVLPADLAGHGIELEYARDGFGSEIVEEEQVPVGQDSGVVLTPVNTLPRPYHLLPIEIHHRDRIQHQHRCQESSPLEFAGPAFELSRQQPETVRVEEIVGIRGISTPWPNSREVPPFEGRQQGDSPSFGSSGVDDRDEVFEDRILPVDPRDHVRLAGQHVAQAASRSLAG
jgi:hypothetical protein